MKLLVECENLQGYYQIEKTGFNSVKILVNAFKNGSILEFKKTRLPNATEADIVMSLDSNSALKYHTLIYDELKFDGIVHIFKDSQFLLMYGSALGHVYHKPDVEYKL